MRTAATSLVFALIALAPASGFGLGNIMCMSSDSLSTSETCSGSGCTTKLLGNCPAGNLHAWGSAKLNQLLGVCDDSGAMPCAGHFAYFGETCAPNVQVSHGGLSQQLGAGKFEICFNSAGPGDCTNSSSLVILSGTASYQYETLTSATAPVLQPAVLFGVHTAKTNLGFLFGGTKKKTLTKGT